MPVTEPASYFVFINAIPGNGIPTELSPFSRKRKNSGNDKSFSLFPVFGFSTWASEDLHDPAGVHLNEAELGAVLFALPIGLLVTLPITGLLLSRYDSRRILITGAVFFNIMLCLIDLCDPCLGIGAGSFSVLVPRGLS